MTQFPEAWLCRELGMAVVNISLITDYDAGVHEGTEAVDARSVLEVFAQNAERIQKVVLDMIGRFPADLDASAPWPPWSSPAATVTSRARGHPALRDGLCSAPSRRRSLPTDRLPIGVVIGAVGVEIQLVARQRPQVGGRGLCGRLELGPLRQPGCSDGSRSLEVWTTLTAAAMLTERLTVGTFVANVMNRHPAVLARMAATLQEASGGRLVLGLGIGGHPAEHEAYGIDFPPPVVRARSPRGGGRGPAGVVERRPGDPAVRPLPAPRCVRLPDPGPTTADPHRRRHAGGRPPRGTDRRWLGRRGGHVRTAPPRVPRGARCGGPEARRPARRAGVWRSESAATTHSPRNRCSLRHARSWQSGGGPVPTRSS